MANMTLKSAASYNLGGKEWPGSVELQIWQHWMKLVLHPGCLQQLRWCWHYTEKWEETASRQGISFKLLQRTPLQINTAASFSVMAVLISCGRCKVQLSHTHYCSKRTIYCFKQTIASLCNVPSNTRRNTEKKHGQKMRTQENESEYINDLRNKRIFLHKRAERQGCKGKGKGIHNLWSLLASSMNYQSDLSDHREIVKCSKPATEVRSKKDFTKHTAPCSSADLGLTSWLLTHSEHLQNSIFSCSVAKTPDRRLRTLHVALSLIC